MNSKAKTTAKGMLSSPVTIVHVDRVVEYHSISEDEIDDIGKINVLSAALFSAGSFFFSMYFSLWSGLLIEGSPPESGKQTAESLKTVFWWLSIGLWLFGVWIWWGKRSVIKRIKSKSSSSGQTSKPDWCKQMAEKIVDRLLPARATPSGPTADAADPPAAA